MNKPSERLRRWYEGGRKGLRTLCDNEELPQNVKDAVEHWFDKGYDRLNEIAKAIEELEDGETNSKH